jgi:hypothetical protein
MAVVSAPDNPYAVGTERPSGPSEEAIRRQANAAALLAGGALLFGTLLAPLAVYFGHRSLSAMRRHRLGLQHRGAAMAGVVFGWLLVAFLLMGLPALVHEAGRLFGER